GHSDTADKIRRLVRGVRVRNPLPLLRQRPLPLLFGRAIAFNFRQKSPQSAPGRSFASLRGGVCSGGCPNTECPASKSRATGGAIGRRFRRRAPAESGSDLR